MKYTIALAQVNTNGQIPQNLDIALGLAEEAAQQGAKLLAFPESFLFIGEDESEYLSVAEPVDGPLVSRFCQLAKAKKMAILLGGFCEKHPRDPEKTYNTAIFINEQGEIQGLYRKIHLFDSLMRDVPLMESKTVAPGEELVWVDHPLGKMGLSICYDLRFPNLYQGLRSGGAELIFVPAAFTYQTGVHHWHALLRARAIETQTYLLAPAQVGWHNEQRRSFGHSLVIDPWGTVLADGGPQAVGLVTAQVDLAQVKQVRADMPLWEHRVKGVDFIS